jgi:uncharacterized membrane protein YadS
LRGCHAVVAHGLYHVQRHAPAALEAESKAVLRAGIALRGRQLVVTRGLHQVLRHALFMQVAAAEVVQRIGMALLGRQPVVAHSLYPVLLLHAQTLCKAAAEAEQSTGVRPRSAASR